MQNAKCKISELRCILIRSEELGVRSFGTALRLYIASHKTTNHSRVKACLYRDDKLTKKLR